MSRLKAIGVLAKSLIKVIVNVQIVHRAEIRTVSANMLRLLREHERGFLMGQGFQKGLGFPVTESAPLPMLYALGRLESRCLILRYRIYCQEQGCYDLHDIWVAADRFAHASDEAARHATRDGSLPPLPAADADPEPVPGRP